MSGGRQYSQRCVRALRGVLVASMLGIAVPATAQFGGFYQLPQDDFIWRWGNSREGEQQRGMADIDTRGGEASFRCELTASLRVSSAVSQPEIRELENELRTRPDFIYATSEMMGYLERMGALSWAVLDCKKAGASGPPDEEVSAEREARAREKMQREIERRRARQRSE